MIMQGACCVYSLSMSKPWGCLVSFYALKEKSLLFGPGLFKAVGDFLFLPETISATTKKRRRGHDSILDSKILLNIQFSCVLHQVRTNIYSKQGLGKRE